MFKAKCATRRILRLTFRLTFCTFSIFCIHFEAQHTRTHTLDKKTTNSQKWEIVLKISFKFFSLSCLTIMYVCCYNLITLKLNTHKIRRLVPRFPCGSMAQYKFYSPVLSHWQTHSHCGRVHRSHVPERAAARPSYPKPLITSCLFLFQCTQGTKGLLESAALSPLLATSCPQGKPQTAQTSPGDSPIVNSDPSRERSTNCGTVRTDASLPRHGKSRSKKGKREALHIPNPAFDDPVPPPALDGGSKPRGGRAILPPLH